MDGKVLHAYEIYNDYMTWSMATKLSRQRSRLVAEENRLSHLTLAHQDLGKMLQKRVNDVLNCAKQLLSLVHVARHLPIEHSTLRQQITCVIYRVTVCLLIELGPTAAAPT